MSTSSSDVHTELSKFIHCSAIQYDDDYLYFKDAVTPPVVAGAAVDPVPPLVAGLDVEGHGKIHCLKFRS